MTELPAFGQEQRDALFKRLGVEPHPILLLPTAEQLRALLASEMGKAQLVEQLERRQQRIARAAQDPLGYGFEPPVWADADRVLAECTILGIFGGNRATKTVYSVKRALQCAECFPGTRLAICSESEVASIATVQRLTWEFLAARYAHLNGKRGTITKINYGQSGGFTERKIVLPNGSEIYFLTYNQEAGDFEGWEFGAPAFVYAELSKKLREAGEFVPPNIGAVTDESLPLAWLQMFSRRVQFRRAHVLWPFTPVRGITPAVKELVGNSAVTIESKPSELLPGKNIPDCPVGHMPFIRKCAFPSAQAIYFFTNENPFGPSPGRTYYDEVKLLLEGKASEIVERVAYGFARDSVARAFPMFGPCNIVKRTQLPATGTNYQFIDPAGARNWFMFWVRVVKGPVFYIYRDWPDAQTYGEWAVPTEREVNEDTRRGWDGDPGPAQIGQGWGTTRLKQQILKSELVRADGDPYHMRLIERAKSRGMDLETLREDITARYIDPRAGAQEHLAQDGGICVIDDFAAAQLNGKGEMEAPPMDLIPASGVSQDEGFTLVNELLDWNPEQPLVSILNQPHLFVCEDCQQVRWMFENFTGRAGDKGAAKDPADLVRYMALADLDVVPEGGIKSKPGRGF